MQKTTANVKEAVKHWEVSYTVNGIINTNILENKCDIICKVEHVHVYGPGILLLRIYFRKTHIHVHWEICITMFIVVEYELSKTVKSPNVH